MNNVFPKVFADSALLPKACRPTDNAKWGTIVLPSLKGSDTVGEMMQLMIPQKRSKRNGPGGLQLDEEGNLRVRVIITWPEKEEHFLTG